MNRKLGTVWTKWGTGATVSELVAAAIRDGAKIMIYIPPGTEDKRTSLRLTGDSVGGHDLDRIAEALREVRP